MNAMLQRLLKVSPSTISIGFALLCSFCGELLLAPLVGDESYWGGFLRLSLSFIAIVVIAHFTRTAFPRAGTASLKDYGTIGGVVLLSLVFFSFGMVVAESISANPKSTLRGIDAFSIALGIPYATGALILQPTLGIWAVLLESLTVATLLGVYQREESLFAGLCLITQLIAALSLQKFRSRGDYLRAGARVALVGVGFAFASLLISPSPAAAGPFVRLVAALCGGVLAAMLAAGIVPLLEYFLGYVTDLRLIEIATLDHPLLKELSVKCPGTWNHSMVIGMMAESAANSTGANPVIARVGAYFHDIGKIKKPLYFIENQQPGENRHDNLNPSMSSLIIRAHVKDGIELAEEHKLPQVIIDLIPQHHGTSVVEYFYNKARALAVEQGEEADSVPVTLYQYGGPKPQTKEAGILLLADAIEAAARVLPEPSPDRLQELVQRMINSDFVSGELDECDLTLQELHQIAKSFTHVLTGIHHHRIAYHQVDDGDAAEQREDAIEERKSARVVAQPEVDEPERETLKRLGCD